MDMRIFGRAISVIAFLLVLSSSGWAQTPTFCFTTGDLPDTLPLWNWRLFKGGSLPQTVFYHTNQDILSVTLEDGARLNLTSNQMLVVLTSSVRWRKEISAFN